MKRFIFAVIAVLVVASPASAIDAPAKQWSKNEFVEIIKSIDEKDFAGLKFKKAILKDGGNTIRIDDPRMASLPLIDLEEQGVGPVKIGHLVIVLQKECITPNNGMGLGEIYFGHRRLLVYFIDESVGNELHKLHRDKSKKIWETRGEIPFTVVCTISAK